MIQVVGVNRYVEIETREKLSIVSKRIGRSLKKLKEFCDEVVILSTCNRTEIYFKSEYTDKDVIEKIFDGLAWDKSLLSHVFYQQEDKAIRHLMDVVCGFDSIILGEEQVLGQVRTAYDKAKKSNSVKSEFRRLFDIAIHCGRAFREKTKLFKIPVSSASIVVDEAKKRNIKRFMILGFGEVGALVKKYISASNYEKIYIVIREEIEIGREDKNIEFIKFNERSNYYKDVDCIISATSAPHTVIEKKEVEGEKFLMFDLAVPRDIDRDIYDMKDIEVYNIDNIDAIDDENHKKREAEMIKNKYIINDYIKDFNDWRKVREVTPEIIKLKNKGREISERRYETFKNKSNTKDPKELAETLIKSTSNAYINKAIEVLKEEYLKDRGDECLKIIEKIFY